MALHGHLEVSRLRYAQRPIKLKHSLFFANKKYVSTGAWAKTCFTFSRHFFIIYYYKKSLDTLLVCGGWDVVNGPCLAWITLRPSEDTTRPM